MLYWILSLILIFALYYFERKENNFNNKKFNWLFNLGTMFIILSLVILITSLWTKMGDTFKIIIFFVISLLVIIFGVFLNAKKTSKLITFIGTIMLGVTFLLMGHYNIFGYKFSLTGHTRKLFIAVFFMIETILLTIRDEILHNKHYFISLVCLFLSIIYLGFYFNGSVINTYIVSSILIILFNIFKSKIFNNVQDFNIINYTYTSLVTIMFPLLCYFSKSTLPSMILLFLLIINLFIILRKDKNLLFVLNIYHFILLIFLLIAFKPGVVTISLLLFFAIFLNIVYIMAKNKALKISSLIISAIEGLIAVIFILLSKKMALVGAAFSLIFLIIYFVINKTNKNIMTKIINIIYIVLFGISILVNINYYKAFTLNSFLLILNIGLFIMMILSLFNINKTLKLCEVVIVLGTMLCTSYCFNNKYVIAGLIVFYLLLSFIFNKDNKNKYLYLTFGVFPTLLLFKSFDINSFIIILFMFIFTRLYLKDVPNKDKCVLEIIAITLLLVYFSNNVIYLLTVLLLLIISSLFNKKDKYSSIMYTNYLTILIPGLLFLVDNTNNGVLLKIILFSFFMINQVIRVYINKENSKTFEIIHSIVMFILSIYFIKILDLSFILSFITSTFILLIMNFIYKNDIVKEINKVYIFYPLYLLIGGINNLEVMRILRIFIFIIPLIVLTRRVFNIEDNISDIIEGIILSMFYLVTIFNISLEVSITLFAISIVLIIIGYIYNYKSLKIVPFIFLVITVIIQTFGLWNKLPWWIYLFIFGIILILVSVLIDKKKKK